MCSLIQRNITVLFSPSTVVFTKRTAAVGGAQGLVSVNHLRHYLLRGVCVGKVTTEAILTLKTRQQTANLPIVQLVHFYPGTVCTLLTTSRGLVSTGNTDSYL